MVGFFNFVLTVCYSLFLFHISFLLHLLDLNFLLLFNELIQGSFRLLCRNILLYDAYILQNLSVSLKKKCQRTNYCFAKKPLFCVVPKQRTNFFCFLFTFGIKNAKPSVVFTIVLSFCNCYVRNGSLTPKVLATR